MPDIHKTPAQLRLEWQDCTACALGVRRKTVLGQFVFGEGVRRGVMFVGEGPGATEEEEGRPFIGESGQLLRTILATMGVEKPLKFDTEGRFLEAPPLEHSYITNLVACRSCSPVLDDAGNQRFRHMRGKPSIPLWKDESPLPSQIEACKARLYEEIYLIDPIVIVSLGATSAEFLAGRKIAITTERGKDATFHAKIPGATFRPVLTDKKKIWLRKINGELQMPTRRNDVEYLVVPTLHPAFVARKRWDKGDRSPMKAIVTDIWHAVQIYERYMREVHGVEPSLRAIPDDFDYYRASEE